MHEDVAHEYEDVAHEYEVVAHEYEDVAHEYEDVAHECEVPVSVIKMKECEAYNFDHTTSFYWS